MNRRVLHELVVRWGMRSATFASGEEALSALRQARKSGDPFSIALLDLNMPDMDGETLARAIKADADLRETVLLLLTSSCQRSDAEQMSEAGFAAYLTKPVRPSVLLDAIATAWGFHGDGQEAVLITRYSAADRMAVGGLGQSENAPSIHARVLLVEDNIVNQKVAALILEKLGCRVDAAANGKEAVEMIATMPYDIILMDCQMPEMDGYEATRAIRLREGAGTHIPIVAMTAHAMAGDREKCLDAGMDDYLSKPIRADALQRTLELWLPRSAAAKDDVSTRLDA